jgi:hypothetical protein
VVQAMLGTPFAERMRRRNNPAAGGERAPRDQGALAQINHRVSSNMVTRTSTRKLCGLTKPTEQTAISRRGRLRLLQYRGHVVKEGLEAIVVPRHIDPTHYAIQ